MDVPKRQKRAVAFLGVAMLAVVAAAGLAVTAAQASRTASLRATSAKKTIRIGLVLPALSNPFISPIRDGAVAEAKKLGNVQVLSTGTNVPAQQLSALKTYIAAKVDAIMFDPIDDSAISPAVIEANKAGIAVIAVVGGSKKGKLSTFITPQWYKAGLLAGKQVANGWCKSVSPCKVALVGGSNAPGPGLDSGRGMTAGAKTSSKVQFVQTVYTDYSAEQSLKAAQQILTGHPDVNFVMAWWSVGTISTESAIRAAGKSGKIGTDSLTGACPVLKDMLAGQVDSDVMMFPELMGSAGVDSAVKLSRGQKVPAVQSSPMYPITKSKAEQILAGKIKPPPGLPILAHLKAAKAGCK
jgi:ribose transport system substrate-binding protein